MRIRRFDLTAFGPFTGKSLAFSDENEGVIDLVYGANEAGKSACLRALGDLFFGIPARTEDAFLHEGKVLRLGAVVADGKSRLEFVRRKGNKQTLLDPTGGALADGVLDPFLAGLNRDTFSGLFFLGREELEQGRKELLAGKGEVGKTLFSAGVGSSGVRGALEKLESEATEIFAPRAAKPKLNAALKDLKYAKREAKEAQLSPTEWARARKALEELEAERDALGERRAGLAQSRGRTERLVGALDRITRYRELIGRLGDGVDVAALPADFGERLSRAGETLRSCTVRKRELEEELRGLGDGGNPTLVAATGEVEALVERLHLAEKDREQAREQNDLAKVGADRAAAREEATGLGTVARENLEKRALRKLAREGEALLLAAEKAGRELDESRRNVAAEQPGDFDWERLREVVAGARAAGDLVGGRGEMQAECAELEGKLERAVSRMGLFSGSSGELVALAVPERRTVERHRDALAALAAERAGLEAAWETARREVAERERQVDAAADAPARAEVDVARRARDKIWKSLRQDGWSKGLADGFEVASTAADRAADALFADAERAARRAAREADLEAARENLASLRQARDGCAERGAAAENAWRQCWSGVGLEKVLPPAEMESWLGGREKAVELAEALEQRRVRLAALEKRIAGFEKELGAVVGEGGLERLLPRAERLLEAYQKAAVARGQLASREAGEREAAAAAAGSRERWRAAVKTAGLPEDLEVTELDGVLDALDAVGEMRADAAKAKGLAEAAERRVGEFTAEAKKHVALLAPDLEADAGGLRALRARCREAVDRAEHKRRLEKALAEAASKVARAEEELAALSALAGGTEPAELQLVENLREVTVGLQASAGGRPVAEFVEEADGLDVAEAEASVVRLAHEDQALADQERQVIEALGEQRRVTDGYKRENTKAAAAAENVAALESRVGALAARWAELRTARGLVLAAVERFREANQSAVLTRAGSLFSELTLQSFSGITTDYLDDDTPVLSGLRPAGDAVGVGGMSEGTADALYLALRIAALERHLEGGGKAPLVVDDLLVTFDDARAAAVFRVLAGLAQRTQVIVFTHHAHLLEVAKSALGDAGLHIGTLGGK